MSKQSKYCLIGSSIAALLILFMVTALPPMVRGKAVAALVEATGRKARIRSISFNPFTLTAVVEGFAIEGNDEPPLVSVPRLSASISPASLYHRALILSEVTVDSPAFHLVRLGPNRYNFTDILERQQKSAKHKGKGSFHFSVNNITLKDGSLDFEDRLVAGGRRHTIRRLNVALPFVSNIPYLADKYVAPRISAVVNGAPFSFEGKLKPLSKSLETSVQLHLKELSLPEYVAYAPVKPPVELRSGFLTTDLSVSYRVSADRKPELNVAGAARLDGVRLSMPDNKPLASFASLQVNASRLELFARQFLFQSIKLDTPRLFVDRDRTGAWFYSRLLPPGQDGEKAKAPDKKSSDQEGEVPVVAISSLSVNDGSIHISDAFPAGGFRTTLSALQLSIDGFGTAPEKVARYKLSLQADEAGFATDGTFSMAPLAVTSSASLTGLKIGRAWPYLSRYLTAPVQGTLDLSGKIRFSKKDGLALEQASLSLKDLSARYGKREGVRLDSVKTNGISFWQKENRLEVGELKISGGDVSLSREIDGSISLLSLLARRPAPAGSAELAAASQKRNAPKAERGGAPLAYRLKHFRLERLKVSFTDKSREEEPNFTLSNVALDLADLSGPRFAPAKVRFSSKFGKDATLKTSGELTALPFRYRGDLSVARLPIRDFEAYFPDSFNFYLVDGNLDTVVHLDLALKEGQVTGAFSGSAGMRHFHVIDALAEEDLLKWESLQLDEIQGNLAPFSLSIRQVALNDVYSRVEVRKDGTLNLQNLIAKQEEPVQSLPSPGSLSQASKEPATMTAVAPVTSSRRQIAIGGVSIQNGTLSFSDHHLSQPFNSTFYNLGGRVSGLSSEDAKFAEVDLRGNLENHSPMQITGKVNPLRGDLFVDLKLSFRDIDLPPVTPYSGTYLGYTVETGKLFLDLMYRIDKKKLDAQNRVFVDQFTFGKKVDSDKATNLPVRLAVALLKDSKGEIHLDLPVTGKTDDPKFSVWGVVGQMLKNLLVKAATSPFTLLASMAGSGDDFSVVRFASGSRKVPETEEQKLRQLAKMLADRPGLKVEIKGFVDKERDPEGYRQELLNRKLRNEKFLHLVRSKQLKEGEGAETLQVNGGEYSEYLKAVYKKEKFAKPRNGLGLVKDLPEEEMRKLILANTAVGENELQALARERASAVMTYLVAKGGLRSERLFLKNDDIYQAREKGGASTSRVEFNAIAQ